jgi:tetraacyldisaccharide 4'-kinase
LNARRPLLLPLVPVYRAGLTIKNSLIDAGLLPVKRLTKPVMSVGSLSAGGAGKTPVVKLLARLLAAHGIAADVLSRGYGRSGSGVERVDLHADGNDAARFGDEPVELAQAGLTVYVGADRHAAGRLAEANGNPQVHLLDDGFQHRKLARDLDIVLLTRSDVEDRLLPAGNLREPLSALRRAQVIVLREDEADELRPLATRYGAEVWVIRRRLLLPATMPARPLAFCGIARPEGFFADLAEAGCRPAGALAFNDHHAYLSTDLTRLTAAAKACGADGFVTTAKDAVKLPPAALVQLNEAGPVVVAHLEVELTEEEAALAKMLRVIGQRA